MTETIQPLWTPSEDRIAGTNLAHFITAVNARWDANLPCDFAALHSFSLEEMEKFWLSVWEFCGVIGDGPGERVLADGDKMPGAKFFPDAKVNFAENLLRRNDDGEAMVFRAEDKATERMTWRQLMSVFPACSRG